MVHYTTNRWTRYTRRQISGYSRCYKKVYEWVHHVKELNKLGNLEGNECFTAAKVWRHHHITSNTFQCLSKVYCNDSSCNGCCEKNSGSLKSRTGTCCHSWPATVHTGLGLVQNRFSVCDATHREDHFVIMRGVLHVEIDVFKCLCD